MLMATGMMKAATMMKKNEVEDAVEELRCCGAPVHEPRPHTPKTGLKPKV